MLQNLVRMTVPAPGTVNVGTVITLGAAVAGFQTYAQEFGTTGASAFFALSDGNGRTLAGICTVPNSGTIVVSQILWNQRLGGTAGETFSSACEVWNDVPAQRLPWLDAAGNLSLIAPAADAHAARRRDLSREYLRTTPAITGSPSTIELALDATFDGFEFEWFNLAPSAADIPLSFQLSVNGGSSWVSGASDYQYNAIGVNASGTAVVTPTNSSAPLVSFNQSTSVGTHGLMRLYLPATSGQPQWRADAAGVTTTGSNTAILSGVTVNSITRPNRIRFFFNTTTFQNRGAIIQRGIRQ